MNDSTVKDLDEILRKAKSARRKLEPEWYMCLAYYQGRQWVAFEQGRLFQPTLKANRITIVDNRIMPVVQTQIAKMTKNRPVFTVSPTTSDEQDQHASELAEELMRYLWKHLNLQALTTKALLWSRICCAGFLKAFWDPTLGDGCDVVVGPDGKALNGANGAPLRPGDVDPYQLAQSLNLPQGSVQTRRLNQGDIRVEARSPFQIYPDPLADSFPECEWLCEESVVSVQSVQRKFNVTLEADANANPGLVESRMSDPTTGANYRGVKIREYWCKPNATHPSGCHVIWSKNQILFTDEKPFDPMPYVMLTGIPVPGRLWPSSIAEQLRGPQTELNKVKSQIAENRNRVGNPTILASKQAVQDPDNFIASMTIPGGTYFFDDLGSPNTVPTFLQAPPLPQYVIDEIQRIEESIEDISGQHEVTSANVPPGVTAASAINLLMEADDTRLGPAITDYEIQLGSLGQKILKLAAHYYTDARTVRIAGDNGNWQIFDFRGAMLRDNTHVEVQAGSAFPQSKAAKQAQLQDLLNFMVQSGNPPHGRELAQFLKDMEMGGADRLIEEYTQNESQAQRENGQMSRGDAINIHDYDEDQTHVEVHQDEQKSQRYESYAPNVQQIFEAHVAAHKQRITQNQAAQMQMQAQAAGQPPPGQPDPNAQMALQGAAQQQGAAQDQAGLQQTIQAATAQQGLSASAAQQGAQMQAQGAQAAQSQRHAEEAHQQTLRHKEEQHQASLRTQQTQPRGR